MELTNDGLSMRLAAHRSSFTSFLQVTKLNSAMTSNKFIRNFTSKNGEPVDIVVPFRGESVTNGTLPTFLKKFVQLNLAHRGSLQYQTTMVIMLRFSFSQFC